MRVVFLCSADSYRGSAVSFEHLAVGLTERGADVRVFTGDVSVTEPLRAAGVDVEQFSLRSTSLRTARTLRRALREFNAHVVMVDRPRDVRLGLLATLGSPVELIIRYNAHAPAPPDDVLLRAAYRLKVRETVFLTAERAVRILPLAPWMQRRPHRVVHEGISMQEFRPDPDAAARFRAMHGLRDAPFVLNVGAFTAEKRTGLLIDAMRQVPNAPLLVLCGEGPLEDALKSRAVACGVRVQFLPRMPRVELRGAYSAATVYAHACPVETFGLSTLEAMACGAAVVGVRAGGLRELLGDASDAGILVEPENASALARGISRVLEDSTLAATMRAGARQRAVSQFTLEQMTDGYERVLGEACAPR